MSEIEIEITNKEGIHSRPSFLISEIANYYAECKIIIISQNGKIANAKSVTELIILGISYKEKIKIIADGKNENNVLKNLKKLFESNFGDKKKK